MFGNFRQYGTVFYRVRYGAVRCIHLVIPFFPNYSLFQQMEISVFAGI